MTPARIFFILFLLLIAAMSAARADAASMEVLAGGGTAASVDSSVGFYQVRVNIVQALAKRLDAFAGLEYTKSGEGEQDEDYPNISNHARYSFYFPAAAFGLRYKLVARETFQLYLALGGVAGKVYYRTNFTDSDLTLLSEDHDSTYFIVPRFEVGVNYKIGERTALIAQMGVTGALPAFNAVVANKGTGTVEELKLNDGAEMFAFMLGLRYNY